MHHSSSKCKSFLFLKPIKLISHKNIKCNIINTINYKSITNLFVMCILINVECLACPRSQSIAKKTYYLLIVSNNYYKITKIRIFKVAIRTINTWVSLKSKLEGFKLLIKFIHCFFSFKFL